MVHLGKLGVSLLLSAVQTTAAMCHQSDTIGQDIAVTLVATAGQPFHHVIASDNASYIAPHFDELNIPPGGYVQITDAEGLQAVRYTGARSNFYAQHVRGSTAVVQYFPPSIVIQESVDQDAVVLKVDRFASGFPGAKNSIAVESVCGNDDSQCIVCVRDSDPAKYERAQAVGRLFMGANSICTAWLFGSEGHALTNNHCIYSANMAKDIRFELGAECATCHDPNNAEPLACTGETVATSADLVYTNAGLDFSLIKLNLKPGVNLTKYGYLQARESGPVLNEPIYIPQHPVGKPERIATVLDNGNLGTIESWSIDTCVRDEVGYTLDTEGGSSGSPVLSTEDNTVVALHNCGGCLNGGIKMNKIVAKLRDWGRLPANAVATTTGPTRSPAPTTTAKPLTTTSRPTVAPTPPPTTPPPTTPSPTTTGAPATPSPTTAAPATLSPTSAPVTLPPSTAKPTTPKPTSTVCGSCKFCRFTDVNWCLRDFTKDECAASGAVWCGV